MMSYLYVQFEKLSFRESSSMTTSTTLIGWLTDEQGWGDCRPSIWYCHNCWSTEFSLPLHEYQPLVAESLISLISLLLYH